MTKNDFARNWISVVAIIMVVTQVGTLAYDIIQRIITDKNPTHEQAMIYLTIQLVIAASGVGSHLFLRPFVYRFFKEK